MVQLEFNPMPSMFVPNQPNFDSEAIKKVTDVNGQTIESLQYTSAFQAHAGCELDRIVAATNQLRDYVRSDEAKAQFKLAKQFKIQPK